MIYFLLGIIAVGVLLNSEGGRTLLGWFAIGGLVYLGFLVIIFAISILTSDTFLNSASYLFQSICILIGFLGILFLIYKGISYLIKATQNIRDKFNKKYPKVIQFWHKNKKI